MIGAVSFWHEFEAAANYQQVMFFCDAHCNYEIYCTTKELRKERVN